MQNLRKPTACTDDDAKKYRIHNMTVTTVSNGIVVYCLQEFFPFISSINMWNIMIAMEFVDRCKSVCIMSFSDDIL